MKLSPHVLDAGIENFPRLVLENSHRGPVLVHFWTPKAGPCMILMPRLVRLATEYAGKFLMVMLNTDEAGAVARQYGVNSVPTVKFFWRGEVVHTIHGAEPDSSFRQAIDRLILPSPDGLYAQGLAARQRGHSEEARQLLAAAAVEDPENPAIPRDLAKTLWSAGEHAQAIALLESLPASLRQDSELARLHAHLALAFATETADDAPPADPAAVGFRLAALKLAQDEPEPALEQLLKLDADHPDYRQGLPRRALLALFDLLGSEHALTKKYRSQLARNLH
jgi:putative thioredoxin